MIETLNDIIDELGDRLGIYGAHGDGETTSEYHCRVCFASSLHGRIMSAIDIERTITAGRVARAGLETRVCCGDGCDWTGPESECVHPKHSPSDRLCHECHETTERQV